MKTPWTMCKVAFEFDPPNDVEETEDTPFQRGLDLFWEAMEGACLPEGWKLVETDGRGAGSYMAIFQVEGIPSIEAGKEVQEVLDRVTYWKKITDQMMRNK